ncbi:ABC-F family ATP-binding cassette domain-containing protein [Paenalkalicoccus suaedae]|uniref:ABC-F family ATP-binding cassette domain-containing protein n=1 Tax=Paenalkalicoccus suaedae TaxID=2592382 RepID=A0A859FCI0_9BACI|nr:ABC-F family ATP-binding cassette domain-containing protein [Paenalkalicoccus suaedae]QKS70548.1 ABC-F family ATP-binding cassette domain-containing protein [Paenalkalicoccus suaedae]
MMQIEKLHKTYGEKVLFNQISFTIGSRERIGLVGINGTGKSSLLKALAGIEGAESGKLLHANDFRIEYLPQNPELDGEKTVLETVFDGDAPIMRAMKNYELAMRNLEKDSSKGAYQQAYERAQNEMDSEDAWEANTQAKTILTKLGIETFNKKVNTLSGGQVRRVSLAKALIQPADLLLLDEPTNHLDNVSVEWLEGHLQSYKGTVMLITHDRYFLDRVTTKIMELAEGELYTFEGNYEYYLTEKAERERQGLAADAKHKNVLRRELEWLKRGAKARTTKQKARIHRVEDMQERKMTRKKEDLDFAIGSTRLGKDVIELIGVSKAIEGKQLIESLDYLINRHDRLGIIGANGIGKSTLLNIIAGKVHADAGTVHVGETVKIGYYSQNHEEMDENLRMIDYIKKTAEVVQTIDGVTITAEQMLERFMFSRAHQFTHIRRLSGGERKRLYLLKVLMEEPNVLFLDEPTNDLDTETLSVLEDYLEQFPGVVITVSHDRYFLDRVVSQLLVFKGNAQIDRYYGTYSEWLEDEREIELAPTVMDEPPVEPPKPKTRKKLSYKDQQEWNTIEEEIGKLEAKIEALDEQIAESGSDFDKARELYEEKEQTESTLVTKMERWEELSELVEGLE